MVQNIESYMSKRGVKPGVKRSPYKKKTTDELKAAREIRVEQAEMVLDQYLEPAYRWTKDWLSAEMLANVFLCAFAGLTEARAARILGIKDNEFLAALKQYPEVKAQWERGQQEIVTACHTGLSRRIAGVTITETREKKSKEADGSWKMEITTIKKELPPDVDAIKFFLTHRDPVYQENSSSSQLEVRLDTMLAKVEQMDFIND